MRPLVKLQLEAQPLPPPTRPPACSRSSAIIAATTAANEAERLALRAWLKPHFAEFKATHGRSLAVRDVGRLGAEFARKYARYVLLRGRCEGHHV